MRDKRGSETRGGGKRPALRLPRPGGPRPLRYLGRRVIQSMAENAVSNFLLGERSVPGRFTVLRLASTEEERAAVEEEFQESRGAIEREITREAAAREFRFRSPLQLDLRVLTAEELASGDGPFPAGDSPLTAERVRQLRDEGEIIVCLRTRTIQIESDPPGAAVYLNGRQVERVTPCTVGELPAGRYAIRLARPGCLLHDDELIVEESGNRRQRYFARLGPEPPMALVEVVTFPARARVRVGGQKLETPTSVRLPAGRVCFEATLADYEPAALDVDLPPSAEPQRVEIKLTYTGTDRDEPVGRLIVYAPDGSAPAVPAGPPNSLASFFRDRLDSAWDLAPTGEDAPRERILYRGVLVIGRDDPRATVCPDVRLWDAGNTVSRGCHAWLHIYADPGTGADYNTFVIHNNSRSGIRVDGRLVTESVALSDDSLVEIGIFRLRFLKETAPPRIDL